MRKKTCSQSGLFNPRSLAAVLLSTAGICLAFASFGATPGGKSTIKTLTASSHPVAAIAPKGPTVPTAPSPGGGTLSRVSGTLTFTESAALVPNASGQGVGFSTPNCSVPNSCSTYTLTLDPGIFTAASGYDPTKNVILIQITWPTSAQQYGVWIEDKNGNLIASNTAGLDPATVAISVVTPNLQANGPYTIVTAVEIGGSQGYTGFVKLAQLPTAGGTSSAVPRYQVYEAPAGLALQSGEPSIGVDWNPNQAGLRQTAGGTAAHGPKRLNIGGITMYTSTFNEYQVGFDDCSSPAVNIWTDVSFPTEGLATSDAIGFTDHYTTAPLGTSYPPPLTPGRTFQGQLAGGDSITAFTDNDGGTDGLTPGDWTQAQGGGVPQGPDHETIGAGPYNPNSVPPPPPHPMYPNAVYYCTQNVAPEAECSRSDDGGLTYGPSIPVYNLQQCTGSIHGHVKVARDGTVYLPNYSCTLPTGNQGVAVSTDNGITWTERNVPGSGSPKPGLVDPSVAVSLNDVSKASGQTANRIYFGYVDSDGTPKIAVSSDRGQTWSAPQNVGAQFGLVNTTFPVVVAGDDNRAAFGFLGTTTPGDSSLDFSFKGVWHAYIATTYDGGNTWATIDATPNDPVQIGAICNGGTIACTDKRNLLDFNGFDVDAEGRGVFGLSDGCVNCTNSNTISDSNAAQGLIIRQSGGKRLFAAFDPIEPMPPANPQAVSATKGPGGVTVSWLEPDNGGSPITAYNVYRGTSSGGEAFLAHLTNDPLNTHTKYVDTTTDPSVPAYFYHVTAVNDIGESGFCQELSIGGGLCTPGLGSPCAPPFVTVDCAGGAGSVPDATSGELTIQNVSVGEPFTNCTDNSMTFVMRVQSLDPNNTGSTTLPPNSEWQILFNITDTNGNPRTIFVDVNTIPPNTPATPAFVLGRRDPRTGGAGTIDTGTCTQSATSSCNILAGSVTKDGTITFKLNTANIVPLGTANAAAVDTTPFNWDARNPGTRLSSIGGNTYLLVGAGAGLLETVQTTGVTGTYTRVGNVSCSNKPPIADFAANPVSGNAPLVVSFDASASREPAGACGAINSYTLDFGDGSAAITQSSPNFTHTYNSPGSYPARLIVADSVGQVSTNPAEQIITVASSAAPALSSVKSRMIHGNNIGAKDINLPLTGTRGIECRQPATPQNYTMVFKFVNPLISVEQATVTSGTGSVPNNKGAINPNDAHEYLVNLTGVTNQQNIQVTLVNARDAGAVGNVSARMGVLIGDSDGSGRVDSNDVTLVRQQALQDVTDSNAREDIDLSGRVDSNDVTTARQQAQGLPSIP